MSLYSLASLGAISRVQLAKEKGEVVLLQGRVKSLQSDIKRQEESFLKQISFKIHYLFLRLIFHQSLTRVKSSLLNLLIRSVKHALL